MKKFLVGVIFLIPIVVVIALSATGSIISLTTPVNPESMIIKDSNNVEIEKDAIIKVDYENFDEFIIIEVLPSITQNKSISYERIEEVGDGEVRLEQIGETNRYSIVPIKIGVTKLEIRAKANINVVKEVTFYVSSDSIDTIDLYNSKGEKLGQFYDVVAGEKLYADVHPADAMRDGDIQWSSDNTNVLDVNANGEIKIIGRGLARIKATVVDKDGNTVSAMVDVDTDKAIVASTTIYTQNDITLDYLQENYALNNGVEVMYLENNVYAFTKDGVSVQVEVLKVSTEEWGFIDLASTMYTRNGGYYPIIGYFASGQTIKDFEISVSNTDVIEYEPITGMLVPLKAGNAVISVTYNGLSIEKEITVRENPIAFELDLGAADQKLGIQLTRTWGQYWLDANSNPTNKFVFGINDKSNSFDVVWSVSDDALVNIVRLENSQDIEIEFLDASRGQSVAVTATLKINNMLQERVKRSFTFNINENKAINVYTWQELKRVYQIGNHNVAMQADLEVDTTSGLKMDIYGNGFKIDASKMQLKEDGVREWVFEPRWDGGVGHFEWQRDNSTNKPIVIEDVVTFGYADFKEREGYMLGFVNFYWMHSPIEIRYLQTSQYSDGLYLQNAKNVLIEGCIFGDNVHDGIHLAYEPGRAETCNITLRNNIFKQTGDAAVQLVTSYFGERAMDKPFNLNINLEGFMDVYNWKLREDFKTVFARSLTGMIGADIMPIGAINFLAEGVAELINKFINNSEYDHIFYKYAGKEYASFSFVGLGLIADAQHEVVNTENCQNTMGRYVVPLEDASGKPVGDLSTITALINLVVTSSKPLHITNECFLICADFTNQEPEIKPGDPVPNSKELYDKLTGTL